jgi:DNA-binding NtrC family response regulator
VDDEHSVRDSLQNWFIEEGYRTETAKDGYDALLKMEKRWWDIILLDIKMPGMDGLELQKRITKLDGNAIIIIMTAYASVETAVQALKEGAYDYITKPFDPDELSHLVKNAITQKKLLLENQRLRRQIEEMTPYEEIIGTSPEMKQVLEMVDMVARTDSTVLIRGESGTGKELVARAIHRRSKRRYNPIVTINCGAMTETLLESELFGHEKGSFTGAQYRRKGKLELAKGGTVFFDELGDISSKMQMDLLRVIETKQFTRLGGNKIIQTDFRVIAATNQDLEAAVAEGRFRGDLYYRVNVFSIVIPPLRERQSDIASLTEHFVKKYSLAMNKKVTGTEKDAMNLLLNYDWPGNVRELENAIERAMVVGKSEMITVDDLPMKLSREREAMVGETAAGGGQGSLVELEKGHIGSVLEREGWNVSRAARILGIDRVTLYNKMKKYGLKKD